MDINPDPSTSPESMTSSPPAQKIRLAFSDSNLTIRSKEGTCFLVHKSIMSSVSGVFREMLRMDQIPCCGNTRDNIVDLPECASYIELLLLYIYSARRPPISSWTTAVIYLDIADKYDMPLVKSEIESQILASSFFKEDVIVRLCSFEEIRSSSLPRKDFPRSC
ncbi:hypothetical protein SISSUDRAFT_1052686 [Sistotremastrum suecicum HHB10207 ss-3]|uniref:BTB domain-containing protein n=1 Tax=Sistotremastrum suecicum HHB10207 ss-3 TaxID=1314776 RepID=A0A165ZPG3_9AGAM|nr:hypothetical protein SISSUDRAFT_1052686 [Sistotremastrum suecicum HHB10207 ss-3]